MAVIAIDFDDTCVTNEWPKIGTDIGAEPVLKELCAHKHNLILWTCRTGKPLDEAIQWFVDREILLSDVNYNSLSKLANSGPKIHADLYIDDKALGIPLYFDRKTPYVDWDKVRVQLVSRNYLSPF